MHIILFIFYLVFFCWVLLKIKFITNSGLPQYAIIGLFIMNVSAGVVYGWLNKHFLGAGDSWMYFEESLKETQLLFKNPAEYFINIFRDTYGDNYGKWLDTTRSYWNNLKLNLIIKLLSVFNIFSFNNYYVNVIFFNFFIFFAPVSLYKLFTHCFTTKKAILTGCFFIPSAVYFSSGIHKEGLTYLGICLSVYFFYQVFINGFSSMKNILLFLTGMLIIALFRNFFLIAILPALATWFIACKAKKYPLSIFISSYTLYLIIFFNLHKIWPSANLLEKVSDRQQQFSAMSWARSYIPTSKLEPNFISLVEHVPAALNITLLRPYISQGYNIFYIASSLEIILLMGVFLLFVFFRKKTPASLKPMILFCFFFCITAFLIIGYTVPIVGAVVRYRSIFFPLCITPVLALIDWEKIAALFHIRYKNI